MKTIVTVIFAVSLVSYLSAAAGFAQGKGGGQGRGPAVAGAAHGRDADHDRDHAGKQAKEPNDARKDANFEGRIERNPALKAQVQSLLPQGMDLKTAATGFRNQGQFIAALHVSKNLGIPFAQLKSKMTGANPESLGQAIHDLKPNLSEK